MMYTVHINRKEMRRWEHLENNFLAYGSVSLLIFQFTLNAKMD